MTATVMRVYIKDELIEKEELIEKGLLDFTVSKEYYDVEHESKVPAYRPKAGLLTLSP